jgi:hypothetical protein
VRKVSSCLTRKKIIIAWRLFSLLLKFIIDQGEQKLIKFLLYVKEIFFLNNQKNFNCVDSHEMKKKTVFEHDFSF